MARRKRHDDEMEINLIPMIDIMLILLIFFMVATTIKNTEKALPIELPQSTASTNLASQEKLLVIGIDATGTKYIDSAKVTTDVLHERIRQAASANAEQPIRVDADRQTPYEHLVEVVELCQFEGLRNISLRTRDVGK
ncbi:MAG: biopolymer transporter ExbD [Rariglobus sp.]|jgi:biopolymer transport protein ExbD|nr:biopolymer transporter ExbD [Rariglobus sp.]